MAKNNLYFRNYNSLIALVPPVLVILFLLPVFYKVILYPNDYLLIIGNDGVKNYFTYAYSIINNSSAFHFDGMNYPYGESIFYLDSQPLFSLIFFQLKSIYPNITNLSIPFVNYLIIFSPAISAFFLYNIFRLINIRIFLSILAAIGIALLSPQIHRFASHLALSYSFFIPIILYLIIKNSVTSRINKYDALLSFTVLIAYLLHAYLGAICAFIASFYYVTNFIIHIKSGKLLNSTFKLTINAILPSFIFFLFLSLTDNHTGRNTNPSGFFTYVANFYSVFLQSEPFSIYSIKNQVSWDHWEGWSYIGLITSILILPSSFYLTYSIFKKNGDERIISRLLLVLWIISIIALLLSFSFPFNQGLEFLIDKFYIIKKFRSIGRFAWIFYFISCITTIWFLNRLSRINNIALYITLIISSTYIIEAAPVYKSYSKFIDNTPNFFRFEKVNNELKQIISHVEQNRYQAILPLPFYHIGSENYGKTATDRIYRESMIISYHTQLPLISSYLTHTSIWESKYIMQLLSPAFCRKHAKDNFIPDKDVLVYHSHEIIDTYEQSLLSRSKLIFSNEQGSIYSITYEDLLNHDVLLNEFNYNYLKLKLYPFTQEIYLSDTLCFYHNNFDNLSRDTAFVGSGSFYGINGNYNLLFKSNSNHFIKGIPYILSYWKYNDGPNYGQGVLNSLGIITENKKWLKFAAPKTSHVICEDWSLFEIEFVLEEDNGEIEVYEVDYSLANKGIKTVIDEVLIYPKGMTVYRELYNNNGHIVGVLINNHPNMFDNKFFSPNSLETIHQ